MRVIDILFSKETKAEFEALIYDLGRYLRNVREAINGRLTFGDGTNIDNIAGKWVNVTSHASGGTETVIQHDLGVVPIGMIMMLPPASGTVVRGATAWSTTHIYLTFSANSQTARLFLVTPPQGS
jgi:hypothetical protein